jgi:hypothetical protein
MFFEASPDVAAVWAEMARRAELPLIASPAGDGGLDVFGVGLGGESGVVGGTVEMAGSLEGV